MNPHLPIPLEQVVDSCWQRIGVWGDRTCPELAHVTHCNNCSVFADAGRRFLDGQPPADYLSEWTTRLAAERTDSSPGEFGALAFRIADEWLALPVEVLVEVSDPRRPRKIPHRGGLLAGLINIRGELHLCIRLEMLLGIAATAVDSIRKQNPRLILMRRGREAWSFLVDDVDRVLRIDANQIGPTPPTLSRSSIHLTRGVVVHRDRSIGLLDHNRLFDSIRERVR